MTFGELVHTRRLEKKMTLEELGQACGVGKSTVSKWERGAIRWIRTDKLPPLMESLGVTMNQILEALKEAQDRKAKTE